MGRNAPSRREVLKAAAASGAAAALARGAVGAAAAPAATAPGRVFYYVDGYHGGIDGHMPPDSLRNVLDGLDTYPNWKVTFEIEPYSWAAFAKSDPASVERLKKHLADASPAGRVEIVSGAYGQAYMWNASGESNVRQLAYGLAELRAAFPELIVDTYAVQEPCWTSCLPQLLQSFGYRRAVLKNSTCWGGYHAPTIDTDLVHWVGPDGSRLTAVPRYTFEELVPPATTLGSQPTAAFIDRCGEAGIAHPAGTTLQDMGWPGRPWRFGMAPEVARALRHVTWREYAGAVAAPPAQEWKASQEDLRVGLPWGGSVLQRIAQIVRAAEHRLVQAEKIASMALVRRGAAFPADELRQAWQHLLWSQHHDVWIVSYNRHRGGGGGTWASAVDEKAGRIAQTCERVVGDAAAAMSITPGGGAAAGPFVRVFNTTGFRRRDLASVEVPAGEHYRVTGARGEAVPCQRAADGPALLFAADVPAMGYTTYKIEPAGAASAPPPEPVAHVSTKADGTVVLETDLYALAIDPAKGGRVSSLFAKDLGREFVDDASPRAFNEFRGFFPNEGKWLTSVDAPADVQIVERGPLRVTALVKGRIGAWSFTTRLTLAAGRRRIDFETAFEFPVDAPPFAPRRRQADAAAPPFRVGEAWEPGRSPTRSNRRPFYDASYKLQALFPAKLRRPALDKNAPFDVCRSALADTRFDAWDAIRHNVMLNWVDLVEEGGAAGLAVLCDHVTSYHLAPGEPLGLVTCYAGPGIWHDYGLGRAPRVSYSVVPHAGDWSEARLWRELARWGEPLLTRRSAAPSPDDMRWSLLDASEGGIEVTTAFAENGDLLVRLFNAEGDSTPKRVAIDPALRDVQRVELDGRVIADVPVERGAAAAGANIATVSMPRFGVRTLRCGIQNRTAPVRRGG